MRSQKSKETIYAFLDLLYELPGNNTRFPAHVLNLIDKYLPFHKLTFIPLNATFSSLKNTNPETWFNQIYTHGLSDEQLEMYYTNGIQYDPFRVRFLSEELHYRRVLMIEDVLPNPMETRAVKYHRFLKTANVPYQCVLNLFWEHTRLGVISIYRSEEEGAFTSQEIAVLEQLSRFVSKQFMYAISQTSRNLSEKLFSSCYQNVSFGVVLLDKNRRVCRSNKCADEFCADLYRGLFYSSAGTGAESGDSFSREITQKVVDAFRERLVEDSERILTPVNNSYYEFQLNSFISTSYNFKNVEINYLLFIFRSSGTEEEVLEYSYIKNLLTEREWEIARMVSEGCSNTEIADNMFISINTVKTHLQHIYGKLDLPNRASLIHLLDREKQRAIDPS